MTNVNRLAVSVGMALSVTLGISTSAFAQVHPLTQDGVPVLPHPVYPETGLPEFVAPVGTPSGPTTGPGTGDPGNGDQGGTPADDLLASRSWGAAAAQNASALGVNSTALAATCMIESNCQNVGGPGTVSGAFQMTNATYTHDINEALPENPSLAGTINTGLDGKLDPANEAIAAAQDLKDAAQALQNAGIGNPTFLDARAYYQWGAGAGPAVAQADDSKTMAEVLSSYYSTADLQRNGITATTTVGQWRQTVISKVGRAASQSVLT